MSLEQALAENTAALIRLHTVLTTATEVQASFGVSADAARAAAAPAAETKPTRTRKAAAAATEQAAATTTVASTDTAGATTTSFGPVVEGDPDGTRYFVIAKHNTVCAIKPGEQIPNVEGQKEVSGEHYLIAKAQLAAKFATAPAATQTTTQATATTAPTATAQQVSAPEGPTFEQVVAKARELHGLKGNDGLMVVLTKFGAGSVPALNGKAPNAELIKAIEAEITPPAAAAAAPVSFF